MRQILVSTSLLISIFLWLPSQIKLIRTKSSKDYSAFSLGVILWLQFSSFLIATLDHSRSLQIYFCVNGCNVLAMLILILRFR